MEVNFEVGVEAGEAVADLVVWAGEGQVAEGTSSSTAQGQGPCGDHGDQGGDAPLSGNAGGDVQPARAVGEGLQRPRCCRLLLQVACTQICRQFLLFLSKQIVLKKKKRRLHLLGLI